jgi:hypothetical protein
MERQGDKETRRHGDRETRRQGDKETGRMETRRQRIQRYSETWRQGMRQRDRKAGRQGRQGDNTRR